MSRAKGARLYFREARGKERGQWIIRDGDKSIRTGCVRLDVGEAERKLAEYVAAKYTVSRDRDRHPATITVTDVLSIYVTDRGPLVSRPIELTQRLRALEEYFAGKTLADINGPLCRAYVRARGSQSMARRELCDLRAAINHHRKEGLCSQIVEVVLPPKEQPRERWLTKAEALKMAKAAWRYRETQNFRATDRFTRRHVARFILASIYTGTRSAAILGAAIRPTLGHGYFDLDAGLFYRRARGARETKKRKPTIRIPERLLRHLRRWERLGISRNFAIEFNGKPIKNITKAFGRVAKDAGLEGVTPHILRHTAITWAMQAGIEINQASAFFGVTPEVLYRVYWHHHPDFQKSIAKTIGGK